MGPVIQDNLNEILRNGKTYSFEFPIPSDSGTRRGGATIDTVGKYARLRAREVGMGTGRNRNFECKFPWRASTASKSVTWSVAVNTKDNKFICLTIFTH